MNFIKNKKILFLFLITFLNLSFGIFAQRSSTYPNLAYKQNKFSGYIKDSVNTKPLDTKFLKSWNASPCDFIDHVAENLNSFLNGDFLNQGDFFNFYQKFRHYFLLECLDTNKKRKELKFFFKNIFSIKNIKSYFDIFEKYQNFPDNLDLDPEVKFDYKYFFLLERKQSFNKLLKTKLFAPYFSTYSPNAKTNLEFIKVNLFQKKELTSDNKVINFIKKNTNSKLHNLSKTTINVIVNLLKRLLSIEFEEGHFLVKMIEKGSKKIVFESHEKKAIVVFAMNSVFKKELKKEITFFKNYKHKNIVKCFSSNEELGYMVQELAISDLFEYLNTNNSISDFEKLNLFRQITKAILYLHENHLAYRDLKCENILLFRNDKGGVVAKLADFETLEDLNFANKKNQFNLAGTLIFIDPEIFYESKDLSKSVGCCLAFDIYSLGLLAYNIFSKYKDSFLDIALFLYDNKYFFDNPYAYTLNKIKFEDYFIENIENILDHFRDHLDACLAKPISDLVFDCTACISERPDIKTINKYLDKISISDLEVDLK